MALFSTPTLVSSTNESLIAVVGSVGTVANSITTGINVVAQTLDMAAIKLDVIHSGVVDQAKLDSSEQQEQIIIERALAQTNRLEEQARILGGAFNKIDTYNKYVKKYSELLGVDTTTEAKPLPASA